MRREHTYAYVIKRAKNATRLQRKISNTGAIAQLGERLPCTQEVGGSIPPGSTILPGSPEASGSCALAHYAETFDQPKQNGVQQIPGVRTETSADVSVLALTRRSEYRVNVL